MKKLPLLAACAMLSAPAQAAITAIGNPPFVITAPDTLNSFIGLVCEDYLNVTDGATGITYQQRDCGGTPHYIQVLPLDQAYVDGLQATFTGKQDHSANLDDFAEIEMSPDVVTMMNAASKAAMQAHLELGSAAFDDEEDFMAMPTGTTAQYLRGDGSLATFPSVPTLPVAQSDVTGLTTALAGKAAAVHTHAASDITSGAFADARIAQTNVTQHQSALSIASSQLTGTKTSSFISDFGTAVASAAPVTSVAGKAGAVTLAKSDVGLGNVDNTADASKTFAASQTTSGTFADARISQSNVTQHQAALSIASSQVTGTKTSAYISDFTEASQDAVGGVMAGGGDISVTYNDPANTITVSNPARSFNYSTRSLNTCFQVSATRDAVVNYAVDISTALSLTGGATGTVYLRTYSNSGCSTGVQEITRFVNGNTGTLTIGLNITQNVTGTLSGVIPAGRYAQLVTENTSGTPSFTARPGQETLW